jgi:hypothetical protein
MTGATRPCTGSPRAKSFYQEQFGRLLSRLRTIRLLSAFSLTVLFLASQSFARQELYFLR